MVGHRMTKKLEKSIKRHGDVWQIILPEWVRATTKVWLYAHSFSSPVSPDDSLHPGFVPHNTIKRNTEIYFGVSDHETIQTVDGPAEFVTGTSLQASWADPVYSTFIVRVGSLANMTDDMMSQSPGALRQRVEAEGCPALWWRDRLWTIGSVMPRHGFTHQLDDKPIWHHDAPSLREVIESNVERLAEGTKFKKVRYRIWFVLYELTHLDLEPIRKLFSQGG